MIVEVGHFALVLALALALIQVVVPVWGVAARDPRLMAVCGPSAVGMFVFVMVAFGALVYAYVTSDFSVANVHLNSHSAMPLVYKISGVWGNHEGSMVLWVSILAVFGALVALFARDIPDELRALVLAVQGLIAAAFLVFILATSNPFARLLPAPVEGESLNPLLQDPGLAIHPPLLYLGYVGFSIAFSFAVAALVDGRIDAAWARWARPWTLLAWLFLTLGIAMGSYWAYYTLGWGGFWFWDPVENASLMPWLAGTALVHSIAVMEKRDALKIWTVFLAILTFSLSLLGTFLVRSGVLTSVHSFASDPRRGLFILLILLVFIGGSLALFAWRAPRLKMGGLFAPVSREGALVLNNLILTTCCVVVFAGTLYPLALEAITGERISVGSPFYALTFVPLSTLLVVVMPFGPALAWKRGDLLGVAQRLTAVALTALVIATALAWINYPGPITAALGTGLGTFVILATARDLGGRIFGRGVAPRVALSRALGLPRSAWGTAAAHCGIAITIIGLAAAGWGIEKITTARAGDVFEVGPYRIAVLKMLERDGANYREFYADTSVRRGGVEVARIDPSKRVFTGRRNQPMTKAGIATLDLGQVYVSVGEQNPDGSTNMRFYWKPLIVLIWVGALVMALGGALSLSDRRIRVGLARRAARQRAPQPVPAE